MILKWSIVLGLCLVANRDVYVNGNAMQMLADDDGAGTEAAEDTVVSSNQVCKPNDVRMEDCNRCKCSSNGIGWFCTRLPCPPKTTTTETVPQQACTPNTTFKRDCNDCSCTADGIAICTLVECSSEDASSVAKREVTRAPPRLDMYSPFFHCTPHEPFISTEGCTCTCLSSGLTAFCDRDDCKPTVAHLSGKHALHRQLRSSSDSCTPGDEFEAADGCNKCRCGPSGLKSASLCTLLNCPERPKRDVADESCEPGQRFMDDQNCNECICGNTGKKSLAACTLKLCFKAPEAATQEIRPLPARVARDVNEDACVPGEPFKNADNCNSCVCGPLGKKSRSHCTSRHCQHKREQSNDSCTPGEPYKHSDNCNTCVCAPSGKKSDSACTLKLCLRKKRDALDADSCTPGESFKHSDNCNDCYCGPSGKKSQSACTAKLCLRKRRDEAAAADADSCTPGESFMDSENCNRCRCGPSGKKSEAACTLKLCIKRPEAITQEIRPLPERVARDVSDSCTPGEAFRHEDHCNSCTCGPTGKKSESLCTKKLCLTDLSERVRRDADDSCIPGEGFMDDDNCNQCRCGASGKRSESACTEKLCIKRPEAITQEIRPLPERVRRETDDSCTPGESYMDDDNCNRCRCGPTGKKSESMCTLMLCIRGNEAQVQDIQPLSERVRRDTDDSCTPGESFKDAENCNTCHCGLTGKKSESACTKKKCVKFSDVVQVHEIQPLPERVRRDTDGTCVPGEPYKHSDNCNTCVCAPSGKKSDSACTLKFCLRKKRDTPDADSCTPGESFRHSDNCNDCTCGPTGKKTQSACTLRFCIPNSSLPSRKKRGSLTPTKDPNAPNFTCTQGEQFFHTDKCNTCICSGDNKAVCTARECISNDKTQDQQGSELKCVPGSTFKSSDGCNTCFCSLDGKQIGCTLMFCQSTTPPPAFVPGRPIVISAMKP